MKKSLLGAIVGDILHVTFSDRRFVYDWNKPLLSEKSKISGYTVITLAVAKYIMENHHLYEGRIEPGRSEKRKELLSKTILDLAKSHPELDYPEWLNKWLASDKCIATKDKDCMAGLCCIPLVAYFICRFDLESILRMLSESLSVISTDRDSILGSKAMTTAIYSNLRYDISVAQDFLACLYDIRWPQNLNDIDSKYGWNTSLLKAMSPALCVFYQGNNEFHRNRPITNLRSALMMINQIDGLQTLVTPLVMTMMQATQGWYEFDELKEFRALLPADLLEINDKYFEFMGERNVDYMPDDDEEDNGNINPDEAGPSSFRDLLNLL